MRQIRQVMKKTLIRWNQIKKMQKIRMFEEAVYYMFLQGDVPGRANVLIAPDIACGNIFAKAFMYMTDAEVGGLIAGASAPVVMLSRSDTAMTKLNSLALGVVVTGGGNG